MSKFVSSLRAHHFLSGLLGPDSVVIDLGANRGHFSSELSGSIGCRCWAIEAAPALFEVIPNDSRIRKFNLAICERDGPVTFHVSSQEESGSMSKLPDNLVAGTINVEGITLRTFLERNAIERVDLLKMDIEGAETGLLLSIDDETLRKIRQITVEFHDFLPYFNQKEEIARIKKRLSRLGFCCLRYSMSCHADVLFVRRKGAGISTIGLAYLKYVDRFLRAAVRYMNRKKPVHLPTVPNQ